MIFGYDDVNLRLKADPFKPVRLVTTTGQTYDIYHPDLVWVTRRDLMVGTLDRDAPNVPDLVTHIALVHLCEMRDLPSAAPTASDGSCKA